MDGGDSTKWARGRKREQCTREERYKGDATRRKVSEAARAASSKRRRRPPRGERYNREKERERGARRGAAGGEMKGETNRENETKPGGNAINRADGRRRDS